MVAVHTKLELSSSCVVTDAEVLGHVEVMINRAHPAATNSHCRSRLLTPTQPDEIEDSLRHLCRSSSQRAFGLYLLTTTHFHLI